MESAPFPPSQGLANIALGPPSCTFGFSSLVPPSNQHLHKFLSLLFPINTQQSSLPSGCWPVSYPLRAKLLDRVVCTCKSISLPFHATTATIWLLPHRCPKTALASQLRPLQSCVSRGLCWAPSLKHSASSLKHCLSWHPVPRLPPCRPLWAGLPHASPVPSLSNGLLLLRALPPAST